MSKHTPGPWIADPEEMAQGADDIFTVSIRDEKGTHLAIVSAFSLLSDVVDGVEYTTTDAPSVDMLEQAKANARLIAAGPDMLAACSAALAGYPGWKLMIAAAYRKATGEQP